MYNVSNQGVQSVARDLKFCDLGGQSYRLHLEITELRQKNVLTLKIWCIYCFVAGVLKLGTKSADKV